MTISYDWEVAALDVAPSEDTLEDVLKGVHWRLQASDGEYTAEAYGSQTLNPADPNEFIPLATLSRADVIDWLEGAVGAENIQQLRDGLARVIEDQRNPPVVQKMPPWVSEDAPNE